MVYGARDASAELRDKFKSPRSEQLSTRISCYLQPMTDIANDLGGRQSVQSRLDDDPLTQLCQARIRQPLSQFCLSAENNLEHLLVFPPQILHKTHFLPHPT